MSKRDSTESPPRPDLEFSADRTPIQASTRAEMNHIVRRLLPGAIVKLELRDGSSRRLTVESTGEPEWDTYSLAPSKETGKVLSGYGTTYFLIGSLQDVEDYSPTLTWPSKSPMTTFVGAITVEEPAEEQIVAEKTSDEILWRVDRYNGR